MISPYGRMSCKGRFQVRIWKLIIFDMDGTLYDLQDVVGMNYRMAVEYYSTACGLSGDEAESVFAANSILPCISVKARSATEFFSKSGLDLAAWQEFRESHFDVCQIDKHKAADAQSVRAFRLQGKLVLLTSNSLRNVQRVLERIGLSTDDFDRTVCSDHNYPYPTFNKQKAMSHLMEDFGVDPAECISIGDRFQTDIAPMLALGGAGILVRRPKALEDVLRFLSGTLQDGDAGTFVFFPGSDFQTQCDE